jgi:hypothetical protein
MYIGMVIKKYYIGMGHLHPLLFWETLKLLLPLPDCSMLGQQLGKS